MKNEESAILNDWMDKLNASGTRVTEFLTEQERERYSHRILGELVTAIQRGNFQDIANGEFDALRETLEELATHFAERGLSPSETATYIFSLKEAIFEFYRREYRGDDLATKTWEASQLLDKLGLFAIETFAHARERIIKSQAQTLTELSTPVIQVWEGIVALPLVGAVDSIRAKDIMERLLEAVITHQADIAIIDITGVPVVDTQVANRLMRTVEAVRLLGTKSIITGINPVVAQTLVQLGVDLSHLATKSSLRAGLEQAFRERRLKVVPQEGRR